MIVRKSTRAIANILVGIQFSSLVSLLLLALRYPSDSYWIANLGLMAIALLLLALAYKELRPTISVNPIPRDDGVFIRTGIYRRMRHPMYAAVILLGLGISGFSSHGWAIAICGLLIINMVIKAKLEDNLLIEKYPEELKYLLSVPGFIPCRCNE